MTTNEIDALSQPAQVGFQPRPELCSESALRRFDASDRISSFHSSLLPTWPDTTSEVARPDESPGTRQSLETWLLEGLTPSVGGRLVVVVGLSAAILGVL